MQIFFRSSKRKSGIKGSSIVFAPIKRPAGMLYEMLSFVFSKLGQTKNETDN